MKIELSFDDGAKKDLKVLELLLKYGLADKATFYIPTNCEMSDDEILQIAKHSKVGGHTKSHPSDMKLLTDEQLKDEIESNRRYLVDLTGQVVESFCYPRGRYDERVKQAVKDAGFTEARTTKVLEHTLLFRGDRFEKGTSVHMYPRQEYLGMDWFDTASEKITAASECLYSQCFHGYFHLWGHSWEMTDEDWKKFEEVLKILSKY